MKATRAAARQAQTVEQLSQQMAELQAQLDRIESLIVKATGLDDTAEDEPAVETLEAGQPAGSQARPAGKGKSK